MPYDARVDQVMAALEGAVEAHRSAVVASVDEIRGTLAAHRGAGGDRVERLSLELGPFASGRIDARGLAAVLSVEERTLAPGEEEVLERALAVMTAAVDGTGDGAVVHVPSGGDLRDAVRDVFTATGVVFGAARAADLARSGAYRPEEHNALFGGRSFRTWTPAERRVAPPVVVNVDGTDLRPAGLADFLDGAVKIVLLVRGEAPPAALARSITPGVTVAQTRDLSEAAAVASARGPVLAALFEPDAPGPVSFVHDPEAGGLPWERLRVDEELDDLRERLTGTRWRDRTHAEDLAHLVALATRPVAVAGPEETAAPAGDGAAGESAGVDRLAAWLLATTEQ